MNERRYPETPLLLVDDEPAWLRGLSIALARSLGIDNVIAASDSREALSIVSERELCAVVLDVTMPYLTGEELLARIAELHPDLPVIMLTGRNQIDIAVRCMKLGAFDYFVKTVEEDRLMAGIRRALEVGELRRENSRLRESLLAPKLRHAEVFASFVTGDAQMHDIFRYVEAIASSPEPVLITGESGTGKELIARAVHATGKPQLPFVAVNVAGLDDHAFSDTLFGHRRGAFTGAVEARAGMIEKAAGGVLFLDEIGDLSLTSQVKLLRLLQEGEFYPLGSDQPGRLQARLVFATNHDLEQLMAEGRFRRDLYHRLRSHHIHLPALRERPDDLPLLLDHFLDTAAKSLGKRRPTPPPELVPLLRAYPFPGNVRELRALVFDAVSRHDRGKLALTCFQQVCGSNAVMSPCRIAAGTESEGLYTNVTTLPTIRTAIDELVTEALRRAEGKISMAARTLGISRPALSKRLSLRGRNHGAPLD